MIQILFCNRVVSLAVRFFFFFSSRRRHTRCSRDWSSDVCSSDLSSPSAGMRWRIFCSAESVRRTQKMRHRVPALGEDIGADSRLIIEQGTFVWVGGWRIHAWAEVDEHAVVSVPALDDDGGGIGTETRGMHEIFGGENADLRCPLERRECLVERQTDGVVIGDETRRFAGALEEMRKRVGAIVECAQDAGSCGNGHLRIITEQEFNC